MLLQSAGSASKQQFLEVQVRLHCLETYSTQTIRDKDKAQTPGLLITSIPIDKHLTVRLCPYMQSLMYASKLLHLSLWTYNLLSSVNKFRLVVQEAYELLSDPTKKGKYDQSGFAPQQSAGYQTRVCNCHSSIKVIHCI